MTIVVASIEARMASTRLPGKVLTDIAGMPALDRLLMRLSRCQRIDHVVLATTDQPVDDVVAFWALDRGIAVYRGSEKDVLRRVSNSHRQMSSDVVVEVTGDCPLIDPYILDAGVECFLSGASDVVTNTRIPTYPSGVDVQVFAAEELYWVDRNISDPAVREHVSLFFYEQPSKYHVLHMIAPSDQWAPNVRLQLDYPEDLALISEVYRHADSTWDDGFTTAQVLNFLKSNPQIASLNARCVEKAVR